MIYITAQTKVAQDAEQALRAVLERLQPGFDDRLVIAVGGDGTMLRAIKTNLDAGSPFLGISAGRLGFLEIVETDQIEQLAHALVHHTYNLIEAPLLIALQNDSPLGYAFNDISIERDGPHTAKFKLHIGQAAGSFIGDGIIFATPLGSTAYNLAAGGPIIDSNARDVFVVTPNNPHTSILYSSLQGPHVLDKNRHVMVSIEAEEAAANPVRIVMDGQTVIQRVSGQIEVCYSDRTVQLIELMPDTFHNRIESKRLGHY